jgi:hypothetical protein
VRVRGRRQGGVSGGWCKVKAGRAHAARATVEGTRGTAQRRRATGSHGRRVTDLFTRRAAGIVSLEIDIP